MLHIPDTAFVAPRQINLESLFKVLHLQTDCPPGTIRNHCSLWFGRIPISPQNVVKVHSGHAFRLVISRGLQADIRELLMMDHAQLQRSVQQEVYVRPSDPNLLRSHFNALHVVEDLDVGPILHVSTVCECSS